MLLKIGNAYTKIENCNHIPQIRQILSFSVPTNLFMLRNLPHMRGKPFWLLKKIASKGQTINLLDLRSLTFPTGLVQKVLDFCGTKGIPVSSLDHRQDTQGTGKNWYFTKKPRPYQEPAIAVALEKKSGILNLATRGGKTVVAQCVTAHLKLPTIFFVRTNELMEQAIKSWKKAFPLKRVGAVGGGHYDPQDITIAMIQTLLKDKELFEDLYDRFPIAFFDEVHNFGGQQFYKAAMKFNSRYRFGLSGTAFRNDEAGLLLTALCGEIIAKLSTQELEKAGVVYKTKIIMQSNPHAPPFPPSARDWAKMYSWGVTSNSIRNNLIITWARKLYDAHRTVLIIVKEIAHGTLLLDTLRKIYGVGKVAFMNGKETKEARRYTLESFCKGNLPFLIGTKIYNEGVDFVGIENKTIKGKSVILAAAGRSKINAIQTSARPTTREKGSGFHDDAIIVDFADTFHKKMREHSLDRHKSYKDIGGFSVHVVKKPEDYTL